MGRYIAGDERQQSVPFPERLDDWVEEDNPVRVVDVFVEALDWAQLGFERAQPADLAAVRVPHLKDKLATVRAQAQKLAAIGRPEDTRAGELVAQVADQRARYHRDPVAAALALTHHDLAAGKVDILHRRAGARRAHFARRADRFRGGSPGRGSDSRTCGGVRIARLPRRRWIKRLPTSGYDSPARASRIPIDRTAYL